MIHLFMNPTRRKEWCFQNGTEFMLPPMQQQQFHQPPNYIHQPQQESCPQPRDCDVGGFVDPPPPYKDDTTSF